MNKRLIISIAVVVLCIGLLFAAASILQRIGVSLIFLTGGIGVILVGAWIYMVWMVWRKKPKISHEQMEPERAERRYQILKVSLMAAGVLLLVGIIGAVGHNAIYAVKEIEETVFFFIAIVGLFGFVIATIGDWIFYYIGRKAT
jgi:flagellar biosynthesis protein FliQ